MEEARQHPALTTSEWVAVAGKIGCLLLCVAILVMVVVRQEWVIPLGVVFCGFAILNVGANLYTALTTDTFRWRRSIETRANRPSQFRLFVALMIFSLIAYVGLGIFLMGLID